LLRRHSAVRRPGRGRRELLLVLLLPASVPAAQVPDPVTAALQVCRRIEERFNSWESFSWTVQRRTDTGRVQAEEQWILRYRAPDCFRLDYLTMPERRIIICGDVIWEYLPTAARARCTRRGDRSTAEWRRLVARTLEPVTIPGLRPGDPEDLARRAVAARRTAEGWLRLECRQPRSVLLLDPQRKLLRGVEVYDGKGGLLLRTEVLSVQEPAKGVFFPQRMRITVSGERGSAVSTVEFTRVRFDCALPDSLFEFHPPEGTEVVGSPPASP